MTKRFGFTLAEVLITLGIIGVVAAMTMPSLINQTNGAQYKAAYKKALSTISQAVTLNVALEDYSFADLSGTAGTGNGTMAGLLSKRMNVIKQEADIDNVEGYSITNDGEAETISGNTAAFLNDGILFMFQPNTKGCTKAEDGTISGTNCTGFIDVNGVKGPNKVVTCDGDTTGADCTVKIPTDVYPVVFYDQTILPNSDAAKAVLYGK